MYPFGRHPVGRGVLHDLSHLAGVGQPVGDHGPRADVITQIEAAETRTTHEGRVPDAKAVAVRATDGSLAGAVRDFGEAETEVRRADAAGVRRCLRPGTVARVLRRRGLK